MSVPLFLDFIKKHRLDISPVKAKEATTTAEEAARAHGVPVSNIVKSLVVKADEDFVICLCPGDRKLDFKDLSQRLGKKDIRMAGAEEVKGTTGHSIGGVPPFGHIRTNKTMIIDGFDPSAPLWAAAGAADTNFQTTLPELERIVKLVNAMVG